MKKMFIYRAVCSALLGRERKSRFENLSPRAWKAQKTLAEKRRKFMEHTRCQAYPKGERRLVPISPSTESLIRKFAGGAVVSSGTGAPIFDSDPTRSNAKFIVTRRSQI